MSNLTFFYNYWEYWQLYHKVTFDGVNKLILVNPGETTLSVQVDLYSDWKEWLRLEENMKYLSPWSTVGGEPTIEGQRLDVTYFLINGWKIKPYGGTYDLTIDGNLFDVDGGSIKIPADANPFVPNNITINTNTSVIVRRVETDSSGSGGIVTASLVEDQREALFNIEGNVISIFSLLQQPVTASLVPDQAAILDELQSKMSDIWRIHGLDSGSAVTVTQTQRSVSDIVQSIATTGEGTTQQTILSRDP
jgi:hypothetical protein